MFESFMKLLGGKNESSHDIARKRLQLVLIHDRADVSPEIMDKIREEILQVISKYMEIDRRAMDINLKTEDDAVALVANIPVSNMRYHGSRRNG